MKRVMFRVAVLSLLSLSCITGPDPEESWPIEIYSVSFSGDSTWYLPDCDGDSRSRTRGEVDTPEPGQPWCRFTVHWSPFMGEGVSELRLYRSDLPDIPGQTDERMLLRYQESDSIRVHHDSRRLAWDKTYYYRIQVEDTSGEIWWSNEVSVTSPVPDTVGSSMDPLPVPSLSVSLAGWSGLRLDWTRCPDEWFTGYSLFRSDSPGIQEHLESAELVYRSGAIGDTTYSDFDMTPGDVHYYALRLEATLGMQSWSNEVSGIGPSPYPDHIDATYGYIDHQDIHDDHLEVGSSGPWVYCVQRFFYSITTTDICQLTLSLDCVGGGLLDRPGTGGPFDLDPATDRIFVAENYRTPARVLVFDATEMDQLGQIVIGEDAIWVQALPSRGCVYIGVPGRIDVYSTTDFSYITSIESGLIDAGSKMCSSPDCGTVYCTVPGGILMIDAGIHAILAVVTGATYADLICSGDGTRLYGITDGSSLVALDARTCQPEWTSLLDDRVNQLCLVPPEETYLLVTSAYWGNPLVWIVETGSGSIVDQIDVDMYYDGPAFAVACSPDGAYAYVTSWYTWGEPGIARLAR